MSQNKLRIRSEFPCAWVVLGLLSLVYFFTLMYADVEITYVRGISFIDSLFSGTFPHGYTFESVFYIPAHIFFAIWSIPSWLLIHFGAATAESLFCRLWAKLLVVLASALCVWLTARLLKRMDAQHIEFWAFSLASSLLFFIPALDSANYDCFELMLGLWGLFLASDEEHLSMKTLLVLSLAVAMKAFFLFGVLVILLLKEKNIFRLLWCGICICAVPVLLFLFSHWCAGASVAVEVTSGSPAEEVAQGELVDNFMNRFLEHRISGGIFDISLFFLVVSATLVTAYLLPEDSSPAAFICWAARLIFAIYFAMFFFVLCHPQWNILLVPFLILVAASVDKRWKDMALFALVIDIGIFLLQASNFDWMYLHEGAFSELVLGGIAVNGGLVSFRDWINHTFPFVYYYPVVTALLIAVGSALFILSVKHTEAETDYPDALTVKKTDIVALCAVRIVVLTAYYGISLLINYAV